MIVNSIFKQKLPIRVWIYSLPAKNSAACQALDDIDYKYKN
jgi:hypothetical protein